MRGADEDGDLIEFAFESQVADDLRPASFARLARQSWSFNVRAGLTGELSLQDGRFVQVVEGRCATVLALAARILADPRHGAIRILAFRSLPGRRFAAWTVNGFDLGVSPERPAHPAAANLCFMPARVAAGLLAAGLPVS
jgi:hypothetical protein